MREPQMNFPHRIMREVTGKQVFELMLTDCETGEVLDVWHISGNEEDVDKRLADFLTPVPGVIGEWDGELDSAVYSRIWKLLDRGEEKQETRKLSREYLRELNRKAVERNRDKGNLPPVKTQPKEEDRK
jgi:hypothetical protein